MATTRSTPRVAHLIDRVNAHDQDVYEQLHKATRALHKQQRELRATRQAQNDAVDELQAQGAAIDAKLAQAEAQEQAQATRRGRGAGRGGQGRRTRPPPPRRARRWRPHRRATTTTTVAAPSTPPAPPDYSPTPGRSPHHDDPFLTCVRGAGVGRQLRRGEPVGPVPRRLPVPPVDLERDRVSHAGRSDLVGVPPNLASAYDQDEMAWALYQWQGKGPWGGSC